MLGMSYEGITSNDVINMDKLYRSDYEGQNNEEEESEEGSFQGLSSGRRKLLQRIDSFLDEVSQSSLNTLTVSDHLPDAK